MQIRLNSCKRVLFSAVLRLQGVDENSCKKWMGLNIYIIINQPQQTKGYMTATLHFINVQWQLPSRVLSTSTTLVEGSDDAQNFAPGMQKVFQARGISEKVKTITSDNSPNVKAAVELLQVKPCFTHTLNLAMKDVIRNLDDVFATPNVKWRILLLCGTSLLLLKKTNFVQD